MFKGYRVHFVRNITDIEDKILIKAREQAIEWYEVASINERKFNNAYDFLDIIPPTFEPRATAHMLDIEALIDELLALDMAYVTESGNVYFNTAAYKDYGSLTHQTGADLESDDENPEKCDQRDFALWKVSKPHEPETASWRLKYSKGRPGWHIECSAMAIKYLGDSFDIHAGGIDLRFPHHENEQAQARAAGHPFANHWLHSAWVTEKGEKMSKSLGNGLGIREVTRLAEQYEEKSAGLVSAKLLLRYALSSVHYRSTLEWGADVLEDAYQSLLRIAIFFDTVKDLAAVHGSVIDLFRSYTRDALKTSIFDLGAKNVIKSPENFLDSVVIPQEFIDAMDSDFNISRAMAVVFEYVRKGNKLLKTDFTEALKVSFSVHRMLEVLGFKFVRAENTVAKREHEILDALIRAKLDERLQARTNRFYELADKIRDELQKRGITLKDTADGTDWSIKM
jgi:cysteinyl-tRNA synthetase